MEVAGEEETCREAGGATANYCNVELFVHSPMFGQLPCPSGTDLPQAANSCYFTGPGGSM